MLPRAITVLLLIAAPWVTHACLCFMSTTACPCAACAELPTHCIKLAGELAASSHLQAALHRLGGICTPKRPSLRIASMRFHAVQITATPVPVQPCGCRRMPRAAEPPAVGMALESRQHTTAALSAPTLAPLPQQPGHRGRVPPPPAPAAAQSPWHLQFAGWGQQHGAGEARVANGRRHKAAACTLRATSRCFRAQASSPSASPLIGAPSPLMSAPGASLTMAAMRTRVRWAKCRRGSRPRAGRRAGTVTARSGGQQKDRAALLPKSCSAAQHEHSTIKPSPWYALAASPSALCAAAWHGGRAAAAQQRCKAARCAPEGAASA